MEKLNDANPYDILQISPAADRQAIKAALAAKQRESRGTIERQQALKARNLLSNVDTRTLIDAFTPSFISSITESELTIEGGQLTADRVDWLSLVDEDRILEQDIQSYLQAIVRYTLGEIPLPSNNPQITNDFDGLNEFIATWLK